MVGAEFGNLLQNFFMFVSKMTVKNILSVYKHVNLPKEILNLPVSNNLYDINHALIRTHFILGYDDNSRTKSVITVLTQIYLNQIREQLRRITNKHCNE